MISIAAITAAICIMFAAIKSTARKDVVLWNRKQKFLIRIAAVLPLSVGLGCYYGVVLSDGWHVGKPASILFSLLLLSYAFVLARLNYTVILFTWLSSFLLTFLFIVIFLFVKSEPLLLPFIALGIAYSWFVGKALARS